MHVGKCPMRKIHGSDGLGLGVVSSHAEYVSTNWYISVRIGIYISTNWYISVRIGIFQYELVYVSTNWYISVRIGIFQYELVYFSTNWYHAKACICLRMDVCETRLTIT